MAEEKDIYASMRVDFYKKFKDSIIPLVQQHDSTRKEKLKIAILSSSLLTILGVLLLCFCEDSGWCVVPFTFAYASWFFIKKNFENSIKEKIMPTVCSCFGDLNWYAGFCPYGELFTSSFLIPSYTSEEYDDIFSGSYHDVKIEIIESEYERGSGKNRHTTFDGVIVKLGMNKRFTGHTVIKPDELLNIPPSFGLHHTNLEDPEFNKKFDVYTNDEVEARYLITPSFMERLKNMETAFNAGTASCVFYNDFLMIALPTKKDLFSICSLTKPIDTPDQYFQMYDEIESIVKLIDHFKLNQKIGL